MPKKVRKMVVENLWRIGEHESWFSDMAKEGWHLQKIGRLFAYFEQGEPKDTRYRIDTFSNKDINAEDKEMFQEAGWTHITRLGKYTVFSSPAALQAPELHTDPAEQSYTLKDLSKKFWRSSIAIIILCVLGIVLLFYTLFLGRPFTLVLIEGQFTLFVAMFAYAFTAYTMLQGSLSIRKLIKKLQAGSAVDHHAPWRRKRRVALTIQGSLFLLAIASLLMNFVQIAFGKTQTLPFESDTLPIVRLVEIEQNPNLVIKQYDEDSFVDWMNKYTYNWSLFAPRQYKASESGVIPGQVWQEDDVTYSPGLYTQVYQLLFPAMKNSLVDALIQEDSHRGDIIEQESDVFDILFIRQEEGIMHVFAAKGKGVIEVRYYGQADTETILGIVEEKLSLIAA